MGGKPPSSEDVSTRNSKKKAGKKRTAPELAKTNGRGGGRWGGHINIENMRTVEEIDSPTKAKSEQWTGK